MRRIFIEALVQYLRVYGVIFYLNLLGIPLTLNLTRLTSGGPVRSSNQEGRQKDMKQGLGAANINGKSQMPPPMRRSKILS